MTLDEKLDNFYQSAIDDATAQSIKILDSFIESQKTMAEEKKEALTKQAELRLRTESENLIREKNKQISNESINIKREISQKTKEKIDSIFIDVEQKLIDYMKTPAYQNFIVNKIKEAITFANGDELIIYINPSDENLKSSIESLVNTEVTVSNTDFFGGIRCVIPDRHILIDNSFMSKLKEEKANFKL